MKLQPFLFPELHQNGAYPWVAQPWNEMVSSWKRGSGAFPRANEHRGYVWTIVEWCIYIYIYKYMCQMRISRTYWIFENMSETLHNKLIIGMVLSVSQLPLPVRHWRINSLPAQWNHIRAATYALEWTTLGALVWEWPWDFHTRKVRVV